MHWLDVAWTNGRVYGPPFLIVLTVLVFVHELGHYLVARWNKVRVEVFSIGFGPELFGWTDRSGTRWKFSAIPLGGYVKMFGDSDATSMPGQELSTMTDAEMAVAFHHKRLGQRAAIVAAGPFANFLFAIVVKAVLFSTVGQAFTPAMVGEVVAASAAEKAGIKTGDLIVAIGDRQIRSFEEVQQIVSFNAGTPLAITVKRGDSTVPLEATPQVVDQRDRFGNHYRLGRLGITRPVGESDYVKRDPISAVWWATYDTYNFSVGTLQGAWQVISGLRSADELGGPIRIMQMTGEVGQLGILPLIQLTIFLSINLGLINLFPIPILDGGHLLFYAAEALRGRPLGPRAQEYGFRLGLALVVMLMLFVTWNDVRQLLGLGT